MHLPTVLAGSLLLAFGIGTLVLRQTSPQAFKKLAPMKERWGDKTGTTVHVLGYSIVPIVAGAIFLVSGLQGIAAT